MPSAHEHGPRFISATRSCPPKGCSYFDDGSGSDDGGIGGGALLVSGASGLVLPGAGAGGGEPGRPGSVSLMRFGMGALGTGAAVDVLVPPVGSKVEVEVGGGGMFGAVLDMPVREVGVGPKRSFIVLGVGAGVMSKLRFSAGRRVLCMVGEPGGSGLAVPPGIVGLEASGSAGLPVAVLFTGTAPPDMVEKPVVDSGPLTVAVAVETGVPPVVAGAVAVLLLGAKVDGVLYRVLLLRQQSQPARAIPAQATPSRPIKGFLPIGNPFPRVEMNHARANPCAAVMCGCLHPFQSSPVID